MNIKQIKNLTFNKNNAPEVVDAANALAIATDRSTHDSVKRLILEAGVARTEHPDLYQEFMEKVNKRNSQPQPALAS